MEFDVVLDDGRLAHCWQACHQQYENCVFSAGLVGGIEPDIAYLRIEGRGEPLTLFLRPDEALAILYVLSGTLWSVEMEKFADLCTITEDHMDNKKADQDYKPEWHEWGFLILLVLLAIASGYLRYKR